MPTHVSVSTGFGMQPVRITPLPSSWWVSVHLLLLFHGRCSAFNYFFQGSGTKLADIPIGESGCDIMIAVCRVLVCDGAPLK